jgi:hypothetical protein
MDFLESRLKLDNILERIDIFCAKNFKEEKKVFIMLKLKFEILEYVEKYKDLVKEKQKNGHYFSCVWYDPKHDTSGPETCICSRVLGSASMVAQLNSKAIELLKRPTS